MLSVAVIWLIRYCGLPRAIGAADDKDFFVVARRSFCCGRAVVNTGASEAVHVGDAEPTPGAASGQQHRRACDLGAVGESEDAEVAIAAELECFLRCQDFATEFAGLRDGAAGEVATAESGREAKIVFNAGTERGPATGGLAINHQCFQAFAGSIDGGSQASGASADNDQIIKLCVGFGVEAKTLCEGF